MRAMPTRTDTAIPIQKGWSLVALSLTRPEGAGGGADRGAMSLARATPIKMVTPGVTRNIHFGLLAHHFSALCGNDGDDQDGKRAARSALGIGRPAHGGEREEGPWDRPSRAYPMATAITGPETAMA